MQDALEALLGLVIVLFVGAAIFIVPIFWVVSCQDATITIQEKERITDGGNSKYLVFTENEVFENTDSWLKLKFNSSDVYRDLKESETVTAEVCGWRVPFLSWYRNIIKIK